MALTNSQLSQSQCSEPVLKAGLYIMNFLAVKMRADNLRMSGKKEMCYIYFVWRLK